MQQSNIERRSVLFIAAGIVAIILAAFSGVVHCDFVYLDDTSHVFENATVRAGLTWDGMVHAFSQPHASLWVPLTTLSFMADVSLFGLSPFAMHIENVLWHAGAAVLLFLALRRLTGRLWPSAIVAALLGVHPVNVESVVWVSERKNVLCAFFFMVALWSWSRWAMERRVGAWWGALVAFAAALLSKPMAVTLPCVLLLLDAWPLRRRFSWALILEKLPFFMLSAATSLIATRATQPRDAMVSVEILPVAARFTNALCSYGAYLRDLVWPEKLAVFYPHPSVAQWAPALGILASLLFALGLAIWQWRRHPYFLIGLLIFLGMLVPNLGFVQVGSQSRADRFMYLAQIGFFIAVVWLGDALLSKRLRIPAAISVLGALGFATASQVTKWENSQTLFQHAASVTKDNAMALEHLAYALNRAGKTALAAQKLEESLTIFPENAGAWSELGAIHMRLGEHKLAARDFRNAVALNPRDQFVRCNFAIALGAAGETAAAEAELRKLIPAGMPQAHYQLGVLLGKLARKDEARTHLEKAMELSPSNEVFGRALQKLND